MTDRQPGTPDEPLPDATDATEPEAEVDEEIVEAEASKEQRVKAFALGHPCLELCCLGDDPVIAQCGELWLQCIDLRHKRANRLDLAVIRRAEDLPRERSETQHVFSAWS